MSGVLLDEATAALVDAVLRKMRVRSRPKKLVRVRETVPRRGLLKRDTDVWPAKP